MNQIQLDKKEILQRLLQEVYPFPEESLFLGVATDELPILVNMTDPVPGGLLFKTNKPIIPDLATLSIISHSKGNHRYISASFVILTDNPENYYKVQGLENVKVVPVYDTESDNVILALASWANSNHQGYVIVFVDCLDKIYEDHKLDFDARQSLKWLGHKGSSRGVWIIGSGYASELDDVFKTQIFPTSNNTFFMQEGDGQVEFWIPNVV